MKSINLMTLYQPQPCVKEAEAFIKLQHVSCNEGKHLTMTLGNANFTDLWFYMVESCKDLNGKYVGQHIGLFSEEENENSLDEIWKSQDQKNVLITLIKINSEIDEELSIDKVGAALCEFVKEQDETGYCKIFRTLDNADMILMYFSENLNENKIKIMLAKLLNFSYHGHNNVYYSFFSVKGKFYESSGKVYEIRELSIPENSVFLMKNEVEEQSWCKSTRSKIQMRMEECLETKNKKWLSYYQNIYQIVNLLEQYEQKTKFKDLFYIFFPTIKMFFEQLEKGQKQLEKLADNQKYTVMQKLENVMSEFIDGMELLIHHIGISCSNILNADGRNGLAYDISIRLCLLYLAAFYEIKQILNDTEYQYQFLISPLAYSRPKTSIFDFGLEPGDRLIRVQIARHQLYSPRALLAILTHEEGHYIGKERLRTVRADAYVRVTAVILLETLLPEEKFERILLKAELSEEERAILINDWALRKGKLCEYFFELMQKKIKNYNSQRVYKYHFDDLYNEVCKVIRQDILYDRRNEMLMHMNTISDELRKYMSRITDHQKIIDVIDGEHRILNEGISEAALSSKLYDDIEEIKGVWKEIYSDLVAVQLLELDPIDYLETYLLSESYIPDEYMINSILINRVALVHRMTSDYGNWKEKWEKATPEKWGNNTFLWKVKQEVDAYLNNYDGKTDNVEENLDMRESAQSDRNADEEFDPFWRRNIIEIEMGYLSDACEALKKTIMRPEVRENRELLRNVYRHFKVYNKGEEPGYQEFFSDIDKMIKDYKKSVKEEWLQCPVKK